MSASSRETGAVDGEMVMSLKDRNEKEIYREEQYRKKSTGAAISVKEIKSIRSA